MFAHVIIFFPNKLFLNQIMSDFLYFFVYNYLLFYLLFKTNTNILDFLTFTFYTVIDYNFYNFFFLYMDYKGEYFPISKKLLELVPKKNKLHLKAICDCGKFAVRTVLKSKKNYSTNILIYNINTINHNTNIIVGGEDLYKPTCKKCFINYKPHD